MVGIHWDVITEIWVVSLPYSDEGLVVVGDLDDIVTGLNIRQATTTITFLSTVKTGRGLGTTP